MPALRSPALHCLIVASSQQGRLFARIRMTMEMDTNTNKNTDRNTNTNTDTNTNTNTNTNANKIQIQGNFPGKKLIFYFVPQSR